MILADTHVLLWAATDSRRLSKKAREMIMAAEDSRFFSAASIWEITIKRMRARSEFDVDPRRIRDGALENGWREVAVTSQHAATVLDLPSIHKDPFDRILLAQAHVEGVTLLTSDRTVAKYPGAVQKV